MFVLAPRYNFITHNICMKTLNVYFHAVHFLNKPTMFLIKTNQIQQLSLYYVHFLNVQLHTTAFQVVFSPLIKL